jgi:hypothetical protein
MNNPMKTAEAATGTPVAPCSATATVLPAVVLSYVLHLLIPFYSVPCACSRMTVHRSVPDGKQVNLFVDYGRE